MSIHTHTTITIIVCLFIAILGPWALLVGLPVVLLSMGAVEAAQERHVRRARASARVGR